MLTSDVVIIGAGAVGSAIARELSKYELDIIVVEKSEDVGGDASKSNSAIIHTGFDATPGSLESKLVVAANPMYDKLTKDLDIPFRRVGAIVAAITDEEYSLLPGIQEKAYKNGVYDVEYFTPEEIMKIEPEINEEIKGGLYIPRESVVDPFIMVVALAENAAENGVRFLTSTKVINIKIEDKKTKRIVTDKGEIKAKYVINAAGLYCDEIAEMVNLCDFKVHPRKGQFFILDKTAPYKINQIILPVPTKHTKGKLVSPTTHGNYLIGPTAEDLMDKKDKSINTQGLKEVLEGVTKLVPKISSKDTITQYAGLRPTRTPEGYYIKAFKEVEGYIGVTGIRSTGLTASVAIGVYVANILKEAGLGLNKKSYFNPIRKGIPKISNMSQEEQEKMIKKNSKYGRIICRCESITEGEIVDAIHRIIGAKSLDGIKRRLRPGMGRCQGGFCTPRVMEILSRELNEPYETIKKNNIGSEIITTKNR